MRPFASRDTRHVARDKRSTVARDLHTLRGAVRRLEKSRFAPFNAIAVIVIIITSDFKTGTVVAVLLGLAGVTGSVLGLAGPVSVYCHWGR